MWAMHFSLESVWLEVKQAKAQDKKRVHVCKIDWTLA